MKGVVCCRVSREDQKQNGNLLRSEANLRLNLERYRVEVVGSISVVCWGNDPSWLIPAYELARETGAVLIAESTCRLIRPPDFNKHNQRLQPRRVDFELLRKYTKEIPLVTWHDPDDSPEITKSHQTIRGHRMSGRRGGRPSKTKKENKERWEILRPIAIEIHQLNYFSYREIALMLNEATMTIWRQINSNR